jgi:pimeloyl-ACP methyl ester carboxylesterase
MEEIERWWAQGGTLALEVAGTTREVFVRRLGKGEVLTALHGFPSSSHDWARVAGALAKERSLLMPDLLGFGASEKPADGPYSLLDQADLVQALWRAEGVAETSLLVHDYSVSLAQELLARRAEGRLDVELRGVCLLNGGLYPELHRPEPAQTALLDPVQGPRLGAMLDEALFTAALAPTFAPGFDAAADSREMWRGVSRCDGQRIFHLLIAYIPERKRYADRWVGALESTDVPLSFVWGMLDPVSGAHMAARIRERLPGAPFAALADVGHWPQLEAPQRLLAALGTRD